MLLGRLLGPDDLLDGLAEDRVALVQVALHAPDVLQQVALLPLLLPGPVEGGVKVIVVHVHHVRQREDADMAAAEVGA